MPDGRTWPGRACARAAGRAGARRGVGAGGRGLPLHKHRAGRGLRRDHTRGRAGLPRRDGKGRAGLPRLHGEPHGAHADDRRRGGLALQVQQRPAQAAHAPEMGRPHALRIRADGRDAHKARRAEEGEAYLRELLGLRRRGLHQDELRRLRADVQDVPQFQALYLQNAQPRDSPGLRQAHPGAGRRHLVQHRGREDRREGQ